MISILEVGKNLKFLAFFSVLLIAANLAPEKSGKNINAFLDREHFSKHKCARIQTIKYNVSSCKCPTDNKINLLQE